MFISDDIIKLRCNYYVNANKSDMFENPLQIISALLDRDG